MDSIITLHLEDHGQDFLWFQVKDGQIVDCGPFQASTWVGMTIAKAGHAEGEQIAWAKGDTILFTDSGRTLKYPVAKVEGQDEGELSFPILSTGEVTLLGLLAGTDEVAIHNKPDAVTAANLDAKGLAHWREQRTAGTDLRGYASATLSGREFANAMARFATAALCADGLRVSSKDIVYGKEYTRRRSPKTKREATKAFQEALVLAPLGAVEAELERRGMKFSEKGLKPVKGASAKGFDAAKDHGHAAARNIDINAAMGATRPGVAGLLT